MKDENNRATKARQGSPFLTTKEAAFYLGLSPRTLDKMRIESGGPSFRKHGRYVRYHIDDIDAWSERRRHQSTSEKGDTE